MAHPFQAAIPPLATALEKVSDPRDAQGKRHPLQAMLLLASVALLCGRQTPLAISQWAADYGEDYLTYFKFTRPKLISKLMLQGYVFTADALLTQREIARQILAQDNDYLFVVKKNQKTLHEDIKLLFSEPPPRPKSEVWPSISSKSAQRDDQHSHSWLDRASHYHSLQHLW